MNLLELLKVKLDNVLTLADGKTKIKIEGDLNGGAYVNLVTSEGVEKRIKEGFWTLPNGEVIETDNEGKWNKITKTDTLIQNSNEAKIETPVVKESEKIELANPIPDPATMDQPTEKPQTEKEPTLDGVMKLVEDLTKRVEVLEQTLQSTNSDLQASKEELKASKEKLKANQEELKLNKQELEKIKTKATFAKEIINVNVPDGDDSKEVAKNSSLGEYITSVWEKYK